MPSPLKYNKKFDKLTDEERELLEINKKSIADFVGKLIANPENHMKENLGISRV